MLGHYDAEYDTALRVFEGQWHGWHPIHFVQNRDGNLNVPYVYWNDGQVYLNWNWLDNDWNDNNPAALSATLFISLLTSCWESFVLLSARSIHRASCPPRLILPRVQYIFCYQQISSPTAPSRVF